MHHLKIGHSDVDLDQLKYFVKVAEVGNFTHAANAISISQPALSRSIARLEEELGQPVFERQTRKVVLTDAGRILLGRASQILSQVEDLKNEIHDDGVTGRVRIAAIPTIAPYFLPGFLSEFNEAFPAATVVMQEDTTDPLLKSLSAGEIDVAVLSNPIEARYLDVEKLFEEELYLVVSALNPLCQKKRIQVTDLETIPFVLLREAHCLTGRIRTFCERRSMQPISVEQTSQLASVQELVSLNHGVSLIPAMARTIDTSSNRIYRHLSSPKPTREIVMVWNPYRFQSRLLESFKKQLRQFAKRFASQIRCDDDE
jgi:LysR family hydrogen peroxide-inducible transcriptional activator